MNWTKTIAAGMCLSALALGAPAFAAPDATVSDGPEAGARQRSAFQFLISPTRDMARGDVRRTCDKDRKRAP